MIFCNDVDLLYWEPDLLREATFASQLLNAGTADLTNGLLSITAGLPLSSHRVEAGQVISLEAPINGCLAITGLQGDAYARVSAIHTDLFPDSGLAPANVTAPDATGVTFAIRTFYAQRKIVSDMLLGAIGVEDSAAILNPSALRRPCALGTLQMIYSAVAAAAAEPASFNVRTDLYERLYRRALRNTHVELDLNADGRADSRRCPGLLVLNRD